MLCVPDRESYRSQTPKFLTVSGCFSWIYNFPLRQPLVVFLFFLRLWESTYRLDADDLTSGLLDLLETTQEVPVTGLGDSLVRGEDGHAVHGRGRVGLGGQVAPDDLVLCKAT